jgi:hypothetical protein
MFGGAPGCAYAANTVGDAAWHEPQPQSNPGRDSSTAERVVRDGAAWSEADALAAVAPVMDSREAQTMPELPRSWPSNGS